MGMHHYASGIEKHVVQTALDIGDPTTGPGTRVGLGEEGDLVGDLVADERQCLIDDIGYQQLGGGSAGRDRPASGVDRLVDSDVLVQVESWQAGERTADDPHLRGRI